MKHRKHLEHNSIVQTLAVDAIRAGADMIEIEYDEGYEEVYIRKDNLALGIDRFKSSGPEAASLRKELYGLAKKKQRIVIENLKMRSTSCMHASMTASVRMPSESSCKNPSL